jgi:hypothetical protein
MEERTMTQKFDPKRRFRAAVRRATVNDEGVTVLPPGAALGAHDGALWAKRRNAGFAGVLKPKKDALARKPKPKKQAWLDKAASNAAGSRGTRSEPTERGSQKKFFSNAM